MEKNRSTDTGFHCVGIGASAGGLEAIEDFFSHMPENSGLAFIVIQHLSPDYKSLMVELLSKKTKIPVHRCTDGMEVKPNNIYMIPPKKNLTIFHGRLVLKEKDSARGVNLPIDIFLKSLAEDQVDRAIAVILSGTGSDGTRGVRAIKEQGGMVMVQDEATAKFDGMPRAAISTGVADFILPPARMPAQLLAYIDHPYVSKKEKASRLVNDQKGLTRIFSELRERTKVDFTYYKPSTISRRIERRMTVNQISDLDEYVRYIQKYPVEIMTLYRELLIGVTSFFRDPGAMNELMENCLPPLIRQAKSREIRFWVTACSTGEEAYTLAILTKEVMEKICENRDIKIFATDLDRDAVMQAGTGVYPESIAADLTPRLLGKYFYRKGDNYQIARNIREMVVFAQHNLVKDPPFTKIDLISCRNLLIYLQPVLQEKAMRMFNFSLNPGGILFLGTSETIGNMTDCFETVHQKYKIYRSRGKLSPHIELSDVKPGGEKERRTQPFAFPYRERRRQQPAADTANLMNRFVSALENQYLPFSAIVNPQMEVLHIFGEAKNYFKVPSGRVVFDITKMVARELAIPLATGIQKVFRTKEPLVYSNVKIKLDNETRTVLLRIVPLQDQKAMDPLAAVFFEETKIQKTPEQDLIETYDLEADVQQRIADLEQELQFSNENLQATIEELETANEELQATNEELLASNEELQSTNEELQSTNEELITVNAEYQAKIIELTQMSNDVENLLSSSGIEVLILDENYEIRKYSPGITRIFNILEKDTGRPIHHLSHHLEDFDPIKAIQRVEKDSKGVSFEKQDSRGRIYLVHVLPYHIAPETYAGFMLTFVDTTELDQTRKELIQTRKIAGDIVTHMPSGLFIYAVNEDGGLILENANPAAEKLTGIILSQWQGKPFDQIWTRAGEQGIYDRFRQVLQTKKPCRLEALTYEDASHSGTYRVVAFALPENKLAVSFEDITDQTNMCTQLEQTQLKYNTLFERMHQGVVYQRADGRIISANPAAQKILGLTLDQMTGKTSMDPDWQSLNPDGSALPGSEHPAMKALETGKPVSQFVMGVYHPELKAHRWIQVDAIPEFNGGETRPFQVFAMFEDITEQVNARQPGRNQTSGADSDAVG
jgi:two-component system, chemotaxis family, CheB/CheR fusion protein